MALKYFLVDKPNDNVIVDFKNGRRAYVPFDEMLAMSAGRILPDSAYEPFFACAAAERHDRSDGWMLGCDFFRKYGVERISEDDVKRGLLLGWVRLVTDEMGTTVCSIGDPDRWFYFGGFTAEEEGPYEYTSHMDFDEIVRDIVETLDELRETSPTEWLFYRYFLNND